MRGCNQSIDAIAPYYADVYCQYSLNCEAVSREYRGIPTSKFSQIYSHTQNGNHPYNKEYNRTDAMIFPRSFTINSTNRDPITEYGSLSQIKSPFTKQRIPSPKCLELHPPKGTEESKS